MPFSSASGPRTLSEVEVVKGSVHVVPSGSSSGRMGTSGSTSLSTVRFAVQMGSGGISSSLSGAEYTLLADMNVLDRLTWFFLSMSVEWDQVVAWRGPVGLCADLKVDALYEGVDACIVDQECEGGVFELTKGTNDPDWILACVSESRYKQTISTGYHGTLAWY